MEGDFFFIMFCCSGVGVVFKIGFFFGSVIFYLILMGECGEDMYDNVVICKLKSKVVC